MILKAPRPLNFHSISTKNAQTGLVSVKQKSKSSRNAGVPGARSAEGLSPGKSECNAQRDFLGHCASCDKNTMFTKSKNKKSK